MRKICCADCAKQLRLKAGRMRLQPSAAARLVQWQRVKSGFARGDSLCTQCDRVIGRCSPIYAVSQWVQGGVLPEPEPWEDEYLDARLPDLL